MEVKTAYTESDILDRIASSCASVKVYGIAEASNIWCRQMSATERRAFDLFLVRTGDPLAYEAGTGESRFVRRITSMVQP
jgi:hypothetical protein